jgi:fermentation-respiration switch protein FrsA (DUF1100 family)
MVERRVPAGFVSVIVVLLAGYLAWATMLFFVQRRMMFAGAGPAPADAVREALPDGVERIWLDTEAGAVEAWFVPADGPASSPAAIFAHGNAELIDHALPDVLDLRDMGLSVMLVEFPGYGWSQGQPSRAAIADAYRIAYDTLAARPGVDAGRIVGIGRSLGAAVIGDLARDRPLRVLVLQSPFTSVAQLARRYLVPPVLVRDAFDNVGVVSAFDGPILLVHGRRDAMIPYAHSEQLARAARAAELLALDCGHNDCPPDRAAHTAALHDFLARANVLDRPRSP